MPALAKKTVTKAPAKKTSAKRKDMPVKASALIDKLVKRAASSRRVKNAVSHLSLVPSQEK